MENNPKKSKAFIITFILILLLLVLGYYLFKNKDNIFGTKGIISANKIFTPLLGTSKSKPLTTVNTGEKIIDSTITGVMITDEFGNQILLAEAGEDLLKGDALYISGFNKKIIQ